MQNETPLRQLVKNYANGLLDRDHYLEIRKQLLIKLSSETAISLYNSDISTGPLSQAKSVKDFIVVNQYFEPLPSDSAIFDTTAGTGELAFSVLKELFIQAHEDLVADHMEKFMDANPNSTPLQQRTEEQKAYDQLADKAHELSVDRYADMCDGAADQARDK